MRGPAGSGGDGQHGLSSTEGGGFAGLHGRGGPWEDDARGGGPGGALRVWRGRDAGSDCLQRIRTFRNVLRGGLHVWDVLHKFLFSYRSMFATQSSFQESRLSERTYAGYGYRRGHRRGTVSRRASSTPCPFACPRRGPRLLFWFNSLRPATCARAGIEVVWCGRFARQA